MKDVPDIVTLRRKSDGKTVGFIVVYYDNVLVVHVDKQEAQAWKQTMYDNAKECDATWKEPKDGSPAIAGPEQKLDFLGCEYEWKDGTLFWNWPERRRKKWEEQNPWEPEAKNWTPRKIARWVGSRMWVARLAEMPFFMISDVMELLSDLHRLVRDGSWDGEIKDHEFQRVKDTLQKIRMDLITPQKNSRTAEEATRPTAYVVTDASTTFGLAAIWFDEKGELREDVSFEELFDEGRRSGFEDHTEQKERRWKKGENAGNTDKRIAVREELRCILEAVKRQPESGVTIRLASDALGAIQAIKKGWSRSPEMREMVKEIYKELWAKGNKLSMVHVKGKNNYADFRSRNMREENFRKTEEFETLDDFLIEDARRRAITWDTLTGAAETKWEGFNKGF